MSSRKQVKGKKRPKRKVQPKTAKPAPVKMPQAAPVPDLAEGGFVNAGTLEALECPDNCCTIGYPPAKPENKAKGGPVTIRVQGNPDEIGRRINAQVKSIIREKEPLVVYPKCLECGQLRQSDRVRIPGGYVDIIYCPICTPDPLGQLRGDSH